MKTSSERLHIAGFTLPEVLVAFLILVLALAVLLPSFSSGLASLDISTFQAAALAEARSQIDRLGTEVALEEGRLTGSSEAGLDWIILLRPLIDPDRSDRADPPVTVPYDIEVTVSDGAGRTLTVKTMRLGPGG